jgi:hypothetical protein
MSAGNKDAQAMECLGCGEQYDPAIVGPHTFYRCLPCHEKLSNDWGDAMAEQYGWGKPIEEGRDGCKAEGSDQEGIQVAVP